MNKTLALLCLLAWPFVAQAAYTFHLVDLPFNGATNTAVSGAGAGEIIGLYSAGGLVHGFLETCLGLTVPLLNAVPRAKSTTAIAGWYTPPTGRQTAFLLVDGTFTPFEGPRDAQRRFPIFTEALDVNDASVAVGTYQSADGLLHGVRFTPPSQVETLDVPGATETTLLRIANDGRILARTTGLTAPYCLWDAGTCTPLALPALPGLQLVGRLDTGLLLGNTSDGTTTTGFIFDGTTVTLVNHPGSTLTQLFGHRDDLLYGRVVLDGVQHGFLAREEGLPSPDPCAGTERHGKRPRAR